MSKLTRLDQFALTSIAFSLGATGRISRALEGSLAAAYTARWLIYSQIGRTIIGATIVSAIIQQSTGFVITDHLWAVILVSVLALATSFLMELIAVIFFTGCGLFIAWVFICGFFGYHYDLRSMADDDAPKTTIQTTQTVSTPSPIVAPTTAPATNNMNDIRVADINAWEDNSGNIVLTLGLVGERFMSDEAQSKPVRATCSLTAHIRGIQTHRPITVNTVKRERRVVRGGAPYIDFDASHPVEGFPMQDFEHIESCTAFHV